MEHKVIIIITKILSEPPSDQNTPRTTEMTKITLKPLIDQNTPKTFKITKTPHELLK